MVTAHPGLCSEAGIVWVSECGERAGARRALWRGLSHAPGSQPPWGAERALALAPGEAGARGRSVLGSQGWPWDEALSQGLRHSDDERSSPPLRGSVSKMTGLL